MVVWRCHTVGCTDKLRGTAKRCAGTSTPRDYWLLSLKSDLEQSCVSRRAEDTEPGSVEGSNHRDVGDWPGNPQSSDPEAALTPPTQESEGP